MEAARPHLFRCTITPNAANARAPTAAPAKDEKETKRVRDELNNTQIKQESSRKQAQRRRQPTTTTTTKKEGEMIPFASRKMHAAILF